MSSHASLVRLSACSLLGQSDAPFFLDIRTTTHVNMLVNKKGAEAPSRSSLKATYAPGEPKIPSGSETPNE